MPPSRPGFEPRQRSNPKRPVETKAVSKRAADVSTVESGLRGPGLIPYTSILFSPENLFWSQSAHDDKL